MVGGKSNVYPRLIDYYSNDKKSRSAPGSWGEARHELSYMLLARTRVECYLSHANDNARSTSRVGLSNLGFTFGASPVPLPSAETEINGRFEPVWTVPDLNHSAGNGLLSNRPPSCGFHASCQQPSTALICCLESFLISCSSDSLPGQISC